MYTWTSIHEQHYFAINNSKTNEIIYIFFFYVVHFCNIMYGYKDYSTNHDMVQMFIHNIITDRR